jgi:hypothetical protein
MSAIESLANVVRSIFENISKSKRVMVFVSFVIVLLLVFLYFESHTRLIYYYGLERKVSLLSQLNRLAKDSAIQSGELSPIYNELIQEILNRKVSPMEFPLITTLVLYKFLTGASFGLLFLFIGLLNRRPKAMQGALLVATFFGLIAIFIPIFGSIWINLIILMVVQLLLLVAFASKKDPPSTPRTA